MMWTPIAMIPYTNMAPFRALGPPEGCCFVSCIPTYSVQAIKTGEVQAAAVPVGALEEVDSDVKPLGSFGIGARERSMSVLFFSRRPFYEMDGTSHIRVTAESASSVRLLFMLLGSRNGSDNLPRIARLGESADGELLIGDTALTQINRPREQQPYPHVTDLASEWYTRRGLPFVFARWVVRKDAPAVIQSALQQWLGEFREREPDLVECAIPDAAAQLGLPEDYIREYFRVIRRVLDETDMAGQAAFLDELKGFQKDCPFDVALKDGNRYKS